MKRPRLIVVGPVPPPFHGVTISTSLVLANPLLRDRFSIEHLDTSDRRTVANIGRWDVTNVVLGLRSVARLRRLLAGEPGTLYLPLSQGAAAFLRDSLYIQLATQRGWMVAAHLRGGEFEDFYRRQWKPLQLWIRRTLSKIYSMAIMGSSLRSMFRGLIPPERIAVVPNGTPDIARDGQRPDPDAVLFLSNFLRRKGLVEAVDTALLVLDRDEDVHFLFAGSWYDDGLKREISKRVRAASDRIRFLPPVTGEEKDKLLLSASVLLFPPTRPEGHPRIVLEALAAGLPIVTTNRGAIGETVVDGECGFVLDEPVPDELAACVLRLLREDELRERMARSARARYLARFTQQQADRRLAEWLLDVAARPGHVEGEA